MSHVFVLTWKEIILLLNRTLSAAEREVVLQANVEYGADLMTIGNPGPP
jgi:hypothetical protein